MLYDEVLASTHTVRAFGDNFQAFRREMLRAQRFDLSASFAAASDEIMASNVKAQHTAKSLVRPPFEISWWEVLHANRPSFMSGVPGENEYIPKRVGVLVCEIDEQPGAFIMHMFHSDRHARALPCMVSAVCDLTDDGKVRQSMRGMDSEFGFGFLVSPFASDEMRKRHAGDIVFQEQESWFGEVRFWPVAMMLLNSRNVAYADSLHPDKRHLRMVKDGKSPLTTFSICKIKLDRLSAKSCSKGNDQSIRAHFVRGHFKTRSSGVYWWRPFVRGDVKKGFAAKAYAVEEAAA
jgi:hypothetical protein